ncbi:hypothetical protein [Serratia marcescens]|uniref:hypothetical protein n=1 Tax=Serratia marcescens TaxID=615 RepID=UPI0021774F6B|nr:hypothetical protein [Serratia marcescens]CAI2089606.1 Uncharacterised protein [Serratia marcescens]
MKNIVENQGIKTDKPLPMSYEALKAERDAQQKRADALADRVKALTEENKGLKLKAAFVEARGVDKFADSQIAYIRRHRAELDPMTRAAYCGSATDARRFADKLREAK